MECERFAEPVHVYVGLGFLVAIETVSRAHALLTDLPGGQHGKAREVAVNACKAALRGQVDAETVRATFRRFAEAAGILAADTDPLIASAPAAVFRPDGHAVSRATGMMP